MLVYKKLKQRKTLSKELDVNDESREFKNPLGGNAKEKLQANDVVKN